jgi:hypothetical protein
MRQQKGDGACAVSGSLPGRECNCDGLGDVAPLDADT